MTSKFSIENRELLQRISSGEAVVGIDFGNLIVRELAAFRLAAMDSESECLPLDYLQGHKDGLEWASQLAEANHPETGDWLYDDPTALAKAIRKGPDMPPAQPVEYSEPVAVIDQANLDYLRSGDDADVWPPEREEMGDVLLYLRAQPAPAFPDFDNVLESLDYEVRCNAWESEHVLKACQATYDACRAAMLHAGTITNEGTIQAVNSPVIPDGSMAMLRRWLAFGRGMQNAGSQLPHNLIAETESMLAAAPQSPGSEPATVPGKWIPVSERIPDNTEPVLCIEKRADFGTYGQPFVCWHDGGGWVGKTNYRPIVTHWMPLPADPEEVK